MDLVLLCEEWRYNDDATRYVVGGILFRDLRRDVLHNVNSLDQRVIS